VSVRAPDVDCNRQAGKIMPGKPRRVRGLSAMDVFAGAGGMTSGVEAAGAQVAFAINHFPPAIAAHALNHPHTAHVCEDVFRFDFDHAFDLMKRVTGHATPGLILASPSCVTHSSARSRGIGARGRRGTSLTDDRQRATPEAAAHAALKASYRAHDERRTPPFLLIENVPEFRNWPFYRGWRTGLHDLGYSSNEYVIQALDFGVAAERERLFVLFTPTAVSRTPFDLAMPTRRVLGDKRKWTEGMPVPRACQLGQHLVRDHGGPGWYPCAELSGPHQVKFQYNLQRAREMTGGAAPEYWTYLYATGTKPRFVEHPQRTLTAESGGQLYVVHSRGHTHEQRPVLMEELRGWFGFPDDYLLPIKPSAAGRLVGNAVVPAVAEWIARQLIERA
jgi:DNA (cytosine-5)-methyltransferase 1